MNISSIIKIIQEKNTLDYLDRVISTGNKTAYLKIAEGCSNRCTYCAIPYIRGPYISRKIEDVLEEAEKLAKKGYEEIIVIAQDTTKYGIDLYGEEKLAELLEKLCKIDGIRWIRFLYSYPESVSDELIEVVKNNEKICKYFDIPIQHISDAILKKMNRRTTGKQIEQIIQKIKTQIPDAILRTSLIVGFPGETEEDFQKLYEFVQKAQFNKLGVFEYSKEDGTPAEKLKNHIPKKVKKDRWNKIMKLQQNISEEKLKECIGKEYDVLVEKVTDKYIIGRTQMDVPEMDGLVYINNIKNVKIGQLVRTYITNVKSYDLLGKLI